MNLRQKNGSKFHLYNHWRPRQRLFLHCACFLLALGTLFALPFVSLHAKPGPEIATFAKQIKPLLNKYCISCHGPEKSKANLRIDELNPDLLSGADGDLWEEVYNQLSIGDMPPEDEAQPSGKEREKITAWVHKQIHQATKTKRSTGGRNVLRRLTAYEYNYTLRDLLGIDMDFSKPLPPEAAAQEGFVNNHEILGMSSLHVDYFYEIAKDALRRALVFGDKPVPLIYQFEVEETEALVRQARLTHEKKAKEREAEGRDYPFLRKVPRSAIENGELLEEGVRLFPNGGSFFQKVNRVNKKGPTYRTISPNGPLRLIIRAAADKSNEGLQPHMEVKIGFQKEITTSMKTLKTVFLSSDKPRDYIFDIRAENFPLVLRESVAMKRVEIHNASGSGTSTMTNEELPKIVLESIRIEFPYYKQWPPETHNRIIGVTKHAEGSNEALREILSHFMTRAYRRPVEAEEVDRMLKLYQDLRDRDASDEEALIDTLAMVLSSPGFLLLAEPFPVDAETLEPRKLNGYEIASRLSYFLWSSMPDSQLLDLAMKKKLSDEKVLVSQVDRMLKDPRSKAFINHFSRQWLGLDGIHSVAVNPEYFPNFDDAMKDKMIEETVATFDYVISENRSCLELIDSEELVINSQLAAYYGIPGVAGKHFRPVKLEPTNPRGGLLSQASVLTLNSSGDDTHPVKRGVWVLERLLGDPPPPPPPGVPAIDEINDEAQHLSLRERLESHRQQEACNLCHRKIDPWGVAFENFNGIGAWRISGNPKHLDNKSVFPSKGMQAPKLMTSKDTSDDIRNLPRGVNKALKSLQQTYENLRKAGSEKKVNELRRLLVAVESREQAVDIEIEKLVKETGQNQRRRLQEFRNNNKEVLSFNRDIRLAAETFLENTVNPRTELEDGTPIPDLDALKTYILEHKKEQFGENLVRKLMGYALGRHLDFTDRENVENLTAQFIKNNYKPRELITNIVLSDFFLTK